MENYVFAKFTDIADIVFDFYIISLDLDDNILNNLDNIMNDLDNIMNDLDDIMNDLDNIMNDLDDIMNDHDDILNDFDDICTDLDPDETKDSFIGMLQEELLTDLQHLTTSANLEIYIT